MATNDIAAATDRQQTKDARIIVDRRTDDRKEERDDSDERRGDHKAIVDDHKTAESAETATEGVDVVEVPRKITLLGGVAFIVGTIIGER